MSYNPIPIDNYGNAKVSIQSPLSAFDLLRVAELTPRFQLTFQYQLNKYLVSTALTGSGLANIDDFMARAQTAAAASSSSTIKSIDVAKYRAGQGSLLRFTGMFTTPATGSTQRIGLIGASNEYSVGCDGTQFGIYHTNDSSETFIPQSTFNVDKLDGTGVSGMNYDLTKLTPFQISHEYLGAGEVEFGIEDPVTGKFIPFHKIKYSNASIVPLLSNPSLPFGMKVENTSNTTNVEVHCGSVGAYVEGKDITNGINRAVVSEKSISADVLTNIITIKSAVTYYSIANHIETILQRFSAAADGNKPVQIRFIVNATLGGTPSYADIETNESTISYDTAGTTVTNGRTVLISTVGKNLAIHDVVTFMNIKLRAGDTLTMAAISTATNVVTGSMSFMEDF